MSFVQSPDGKGLTKRRNFLRFAGSCFGTSFQSTCNATAVMPTPVRCPEGPSKKNSMADAKERASGEEHQQFRKSHLGPSFHFISSHQLLNHHQTKHLSGAKSSAISVPATLTPNTRPINLTHPSTPSTPTTTMASPSNLSPYTFQRASTTATRSLVSDRVTELEIDLSHSSHYERAAAEAAKNGTMPSTTANSAAAVVDKSEGVQKLGI